jgi:NAD(P)H-flavin reductase
MPPRDFEGEILEIRQETHNVLTFKISAPEDFEFVAGQHCLVSFPDNKDEFRPFTFSSSPTEKGFVELTIKKNKTFTTKLFTSQAGDKLIIKGPLGETFNFKEENKDMIFLSGGSGITPFMSIIRYVIAKNLDNKITMFNGNVTPKDIIYRKELEEIDKRQNLKIINVLNKPKDNPDNIVCACETKEGYICEAIVKAVVPDFSNHIWYICGPPVMVDAMEKMLDEMKVDKAKIKVDKWQLNK